MLAGINNRHAMLLAGANAAPTWVITEKAHKWRDDAAGAFHGDLCIAHLRCRHHLHGLGDLADVLDGPDALLHRLVAGMTNLLLRSAGGRQGEQSKLQCTGSVDTSCRAPHGQAIRAEILFVPRKYTYVPARGGEQGGKAERELKVDVLLPSRPAHVVATASSSGSADCCGEHRNSCCPMLCTARRMVVSLMYETDAGVRGRPLTQQA